MSGVRGRSSKEYITSGDEDRVWIALADRDLPVRMARAHSLLGK